MNEVNVQKIYNFYEIINDFNRIRILICINSEEKSLDDIVEETGIRIPIVETQLRYLLSYKVISKVEVENKILFKTSDKNMARIINDIIKYINKKK